MSIKAILYHLFLKRGFWGLLAIAWGSMLGGSFLMTILTYSLALAGSSRLLVSVCQLVVIGLLLPVCWLVMEQEYQKRGVTDFPKFVAAFLAALFFSCAIPALWMFAAVTAIRELRRGERTLSSPQEGAVSSVAARRPQPQTAFVLAWIGRAFFKLAHQPMRG